MHDAAISLLTSMVTTVYQPALEGFAIQGDQHEDNAERKALLTERIRKLTASIATLETAQTLEHGLVGLCRLLDELIWEPAAGGRKCRHCGMSKPEHADDCKVARIIREIRKKEALNG